MSTKVDEEVAGETPLEVARGFIDNPTSLPNWADEVICADGEVKDEEWEALEGLKINNTEDFLTALWAELAKIEL